MSTRPTSSLSPATRRRRWRSPNCARVLPCHFVGTVPAIKPACAQSKSRRVTVLGTQATVSREYTRALIREFAGGCDVALVGSPTLGSLRRSRTAPASPVADSESKPKSPRVSSMREARRTDTVVLACTHYPLLTARFRAVAPWPVEWLDPAPAIARRVADLMREKPAAAPGAPPKIVFTSGRAPSPALAGALRGYGF